VLTTGEPAMAATVADFYRRNEAHFAPWDPPKPPDFATVAVQRERIRQSLREFDEGVGFRYWLQPKDNLDVVIGSISISQVVRGVFHSGVVGYGMDGFYQGQGYMHEALEAIVMEMFSLRMNLHRLQAGVRPENERSIALIQRAGFTLEGRAPSYLYIDGAWRDHLIFSRLNPKFITPLDWG
jgi:[ribosomal protein S5]-alanine N-acetyltransferase